MLVNMLFYLFINVLSESNGVYVINKPKITLYIYRKILFNEQNK